MKFIADMPIPQATVTHLKKEGHDIYHLQDKGLSKAKDSEILRIARSEGRIVLTMDLDFGALLAADKEQLPSVIIFRLEYNRPQNVNSLLKHYLKEVKEDLLAGAIVIFEESRVRVRRLPL